MRVPAASFASILLASAPAAASVLLVCPDGSGEYPHIRAAVEAAADGDVIELCDGVFQGLDNLDLDLGSKSLTFRSLHGYESTTIYGLVVLPDDRVAYHVFTVGAGHVRFEGITIEAAGSGVSAELGDGAAIRCLGGALELDRMRIISGEVLLPARRGGGVALLGGSLSATDCVFDCDATQRGGAVYAESEAVVLTRCTFDGSASCGGGAVWLEGGLIEDCTFVGGGVINCDDNPGGLSIVAAGAGQVSVVGCRIADRHDTGGAGVHQWADGPLLIDGCVFEDCTTFSGACVVVRNGLVRNTTFRRNYVGYNGPADLTCFGTTGLERCVFEGSRPGGGPWGAAVNVVGQATMTGCTFAGTRRHPSLVVLPGAELNLDHSIIAFGVEGSPAVQCGDTPAPIVLSCTDIFGNDGGDWVGCLADMEDTDGNVAADPQFCDLDTGDLALQAESPCATENSGECGLIGALGVGCGTTVLEPTNWGQIKGLYR